MGKCLKTHKTKNKTKQKQIIKTKLSLQLFLMANFDYVNTGPRYENLEMTPFENILKLDRDLR